MWEINPAKSWVLLLTLYGNLVLGLNYPASFLVENQVKLGSCMFHASIILL